MSKASIFVFIFVLALTLFIRPQCTLADQRRPRAFFVFGDSLVDNGNNNFLATTARADSPPYGIDFPDHRATGRFSNGFNLPDLIGQALGSGPALPFLNPMLQGDKLLVGANFASAGIGILNDTGIQFAHIIRMPHQLELFQTYQARLSKHIGSQQAQQLVNQAITMITVGGNDYVNNYYFTPVTARRLQLKISDFTTLLITEYHKILMRLYELGARRVLVTGLGSMGCIPSMLATKSANGQCSEELNHAADLYNSHLVQMIQGLNQELGSNIFITANAVRKQRDFITNPQDYGFVTSKLACCGQGPYNGLGTCTAASNLCPNRDVYVFWDPFHPTERANKIIAQTILEGSQEYMHPMNLSTILAMDTIS